MLREGLVEHGATVTVCNVPLRFDTAARVRLARQPWRAPGFALRLLRAWVTLAWRSRRIQDVDAVVVGYLGVFDIHLARLLFRRSTRVLDQMVTLADTTDDRSLGSPRLRAVLTALDRSARRAADVVLCDTDEQAGQVPAGTTALVTHVGAPRSWLATDPAPPPDPGSPVRVVFFGLYTPLQGTVTIGEALAALPADAPVEVTMIGSGQDRGAAEAAAGAATAPIRWLDWVPADELPSLVATHHICLGIFGTGAKADRVVPNKVFQGAATGCALITSDTAAQRRLLGDAGRYVPPGDPIALSTAILDLASDAGALSDARVRARQWAGSAASPETVVRPLVQRLRDEAARRRT